MSNIPKPEGTILLHSACAEPQTLVELLMEEAGRGGKPITLYALTYRASGAPPPLYASLPLLQSGALHLKSFFPHAALKPATVAGLVDYVPASFSILPQLIRQGHIKPDYAYLQVTPPNKQGLCSFGAAADLVPAILEAQIPIVAEMNARMPFVNTPLVPPSRFAAIIETDRPLLEIPSLEIGEIEHQVAQNVASLIPNGAVVQLGVGTVPEAVMQYLTHHRNLSLHGGAISDGVIALLESGAVTNQSKPLDKGKTVASLLIGSQKLFDYAHQNPALELQGIDYCNDPLRIATIENFISVNSALEVDYTGQVNAEVAGDRQIAGIGGQLDYVMGSWYAPHGLSIIALPSVTAKGQPRIVPKLREGVPVSTPRHLVQLVVTEKGIADLRGKSLRERERLMIAIS